MNPLKYSNNSRKIMMNNKNYYLPTFINKMLTKGISEHGKTKSHLDYAPPTTIYQFTYGDD